MRDATLTAPAGTADSAQALEFVWLELTNQCNLQCLHCYSESTPNSTAKNLLTETRYEAIVTEAFELGCRHIQFIGGEPTLNKSLPRLISHARTCGYEFIEVFSNLVNLSASLLDVFVEHRVAVATSVYASAPELHDLITQTAGSHERTIRNIRRVLDCGLRLRVGVIAMEKNKAELESTFAFLRDLGVTNIGLDHVRGFGRAQARSTCSMEELCGKCAGNVLAIGPDGVVAPCIMSKYWSVGSVLNSPLRDVVSSEGLFQTRRGIAAATARKLGADQCYPECAPHDPNCGPNCSPNTQCTPCAPNAGRGCDPNGWCGPTGS